MHILVVEDNGHMSMDLASMIGDHDASLTITTLTGPRAAEAIVTCKHCFDAALVDMDALVDLEAADSAGLESSCVLKLLCPEIAVVAVTGSTSHEVALGVIRAGIQDLVPKCEATPARVLRTIRLARERHEREKYLQELASVDQLTGFLNRRGLVSSVRSSNEAAARLNVSSALMTIDLDGFKAINDTFGHPAGDEILRHVGQRIARCIRRNDAVGRAGGDEFWVVVNGIKIPYGMQSIADKILSSLSAPYYIRSHWIRAGASVGIALTPDHADNVGNWIRNSDAALYAAKKRGKNRWVMYDACLDGVFDTAGMQLAH
jgi:diguanylate cyclase (GGDEF)-like protein